MFENRRQAMDLIAELLPSDIQDEIAGLLTPAIGLIPAKEWDTVTFGRTRIGGTPDAPEGFAWPQIEPSLDDVARLPDYLPEEYRAVAGTRRSLVFIGQIDLAQAHELGDVASPLPETGRLWFFWDGGVGQYSADALYTRVIWDTTPVDELATAPLAEDLRTQHEADQWYWEERYSTWHHATNYFAPGRDVELYAGVMLPPRYAGVVEVSEVFESLEQRGLEEDFEVFYEASLDVGEWQGYQLLGLPDPIQGDPRDDVEPADWGLLFQVPMNDWQLGDGGDGAVYFLIQSEALARRDFSNVRAVYQA
ncbi:DUF1963 domain-containing protein [Corynebacterium glaucum]|uniref:DUF1963 domain-containing protein n=1 Tax=Corynebacterium glaucum TaxID=187491 RepID=UPI0025B48C29|nr:DUF1963 domain-containing protein [Corynebacterium glaucum]WJZ07016.1 hypothetical protein CGLAUT_02550 [Corynebacterium glaucum]